MTELANKIDPEADGTTAPEFKNRTPFAARLSTSLVNTETWTLRFDGSRSS